MVDVKWEVGDEAVLVHRWGMSAPPVGSLAVVISVDGYDVCKLKWNCPTEFTVDSRFGMTPWFSKAGGPW